MCYFLLLIKCVVIYVGFVILHDMLLVTYLGNGTVMTIVLIGLVNQFSNVCWAAFFSLLRS